MKEIEVLVEVYDDYKFVLEKLMKFEYKGLKETTDDYYYDPLRKNLKPDNNFQLSECLRLRTKNNEYSVTYKVDKFDEEKKWLYSDEYETKIESIEQARMIIEKLGLKKLLTINNLKHTYIYNDYEIVLEIVKDLGVFMEVEYCTDKDVNIIEIKRNIQKFIDGLGFNVSSELNMGKPEMIIRKNNIVIE